MFFSSFSGLVLPIIVTRAFDWVYATPSGNEVHRVLGLGRRIRQALGHRNKSGDGQSSSHVNNNVLLNHNPTTGNKHSEGCNCGCFDDVVSLTCGICLRMPWGRLVELIVRWWKDAKSYRRHITHHHQLSDALR